MESIGKPVVVGVSQTFATIFRENRSFFYPFKYARNENEADYLKKCGYSVIVQFDGNRFQEFHETRNPDLVPSYIDFVLISFKDFTDLKNNAFLVPRQDTSKTVCDCFYKDKWYGDMSHKHVLGTTLSDLSYLKKSTLTDDFFREYQAVKETRAYVMLKVNTPSELESLGFLYVIDPDGGDWYMNPQLLGAPEGWFICLSSEYSDHPISEYGYSKKMFVHFSADKQHVMEKHCSVVLDFTAVSDWKQTRKSLLTKLSEIESEIHSVDV